MNHIRTTAFNILVLALFYVPVAFSEAPALPDVLLPYSVAGDGVNLATGTPVVPLGLAGLVLEEGTNPTGWIAVPAGPNITSSFDSRISFEDGNYYLIANSGPARRLGFSQSGDTLKPKALATGIDKVVIKESTYELFYSGGSLLEKLVFHRSSGKLWKTVQHTQSTVLSYNGAGYLSQINDPFGNRVSLFYGTHGKLERVEAVGKIVTVFYDATSGKLDRIAGPAGDVLRIAYDGNGLLNLLTDGVSGQGLQFSRFSSTDSRVSSSVPFSVERPNGAKTDYIYGLTGEGLLQGGVSDYDNGYEIQTFQGANVSRVVTGAGYVSYVYDSGIRSSLLRSVTTALFPTTGTGATLHTQSFDYDTNGFPSLAYNGGALEGQFSFSSTGHLNYVTDARGITTSYQYNANKQLLRVNDAGLDIYDYEYDANGFLTQTKWNGTPMGSVQYTALGQPTRVTDIMGSVTNFSYGDLPDGFRGLASSISSAFGVSNFGVTSTSTNFTFTESHVPSNGDTGFASTTTVDTRGLGSYSDSHGNTETSRVDPEAVGNTFTTISASGMDQTVHRQELTIPGAEKGSHYQDYSRKEYLTNTSGGPFLIEDGWEETFLNQPQAFPGN